LVGAWGPDVFGQSEGEKIPVAVEDLTFASFTTEQVTDIDVDGRLSTCPSQGTAWSRVLG